MNTCHLLMEKDDVTGGHMYVAAWGWYAKILPKTTGAPIKQHGFGFHFLRPKNIFLLVAWIERSFLLLHIVLAQMLEFKSPTPFYWLSNFHVPCLNYLLWQSSALDGFTGFSLMLSKKAENGVTKASLKIGSNSRQCYLS